MTPDPELLDLCREVYNRLGWETDTTLYQKWDDSPWVKDSSDTHHTCHDWVYWYDLEFVLTKLPPFIEKTRLTVQPVKDSPSNGWCASYDYENGDSTYDCFADTPLKAALRLVLALCDAGVLKKEDV